MTTKHISEISHVLLTSKHSKKLAKKNLMHLKVSSDQEKSAIFDLIAWLSTSGDDIMELVKIVMKIVNTLQADGATKKAEARNLFIQVLKLIDIEEDNLEFYTTIYDSAVEVIIWAKKGGLATVVETGKGCFPCLKKK